ncbi:NAD(P)-binding protein [Rhizophagus clarus]|uniref:NAD(P)-binding protein n=1 Tax=Rhizophagus clarus TaxID=94130 RepID=A0A8H3KSJ4_9GLOM|nr:NAD(P)-binding protein [Rhizophagus clarus]
MVVSNKGVLFKAIPTGHPVIGEHFEVVDRTIDIENFNLEENELLLKNVYISLDPYMRERMREHYIESYIPPFHVGKIMVGDGTSVVIKSTHPQYHEGDIVAGFTGWEEYTHIKENDGDMDVTGRFCLNHAKDSSLSLTHHSFLLRVHGLTAYRGLINFGTPKKGETIYVSAAAGAIGHLVVQMAKIKGLHVIGSAGSDEKVDFLLNTLKIDAAFNYKKVDVNKALSKHCPDGIDIYYDNVGGETLDQVLKHCNRFARVIVCVFMKSMSIIGFLVSDFWSVPNDNFGKDMEEWLDSGKLIYKEETTVGIENAPQAFLNMFAGKNLGKSVVKISDF